MQRKIISFFILWIVTFPAFSQYYEGPYDPVKIHYKTPGFISINEISYGSGLKAKDAIDTAAYSEYYFSFTSVVGYYVSQNFMFGAGTGVFVYNGGTLIPMFGDARFTFNFKRLNPYVSGSFGFLLSADNPDSRLKLFISPTAGVRYVLTYTLAATFGVGAHIQEGGAYEDRDTFITFRAGLHIKPRRK